MPFEQLDQIRRLKEAGVTGPVASPAPLTQAAGQHLSQGNTFRGMGYGAMDLLDKTATGARQLTYGSGSPAEGLMSVLPVPGKAPGGFRAIGDAVQRMLVQRAKAGDKQAMETLLKHFQPRINAVARRTAQSPMGNREAALSSRDMAQQGNIEAIQAINAFDPERGKNLGGAVGSRLQHLQRQARTGEQMLHLSEADQRIVRRIQQEEQRYKLVHGESAKIPDAALARRLQLPIARVRAMRQDPNLQPVQRPLRLDAPVEEGQRPLADAVGAPDEGFTAVERQQNAASAQSLVERTMAQLSDREKQVMRAYQEALDLGKKRGWETQMANQLGISRQRVDQILKGAIQKARDIQSGRGFRGKLPPGQPPISGASDLDPDSVIRSAGGSLRGVTEVKGEKLYWYDVAVPGGNPTTGVVKESDLRAGKLPDMIRETLGKNWGASGGPIGGGAALPNRSGLGEIRPLRQAASGLAGQPDKEAGVARLSNAGVLGAPATSNLPPGHSGLSDRVPAPWKQIGSVPNRASQDNMLNPTDPRTPKLVDWLATMMQQFGGKN